MGSINILRNHNVDIGECAQHFCHDFSCLEEQNNMNKSSSSSSSSSASSLKKWKRGNVIVSYLSCKSEENLPMDFCKNSSLHGLKYIGERRQHIVERMFWTIAFTIGLIVACIMISDVWRKYKSNSVIITFAPYETKIEELPFPALTICNMNKVLKSKATKIMNEAQGFSGQERKSAALENLYYLNHVCSTSKSFTKVFNYSAERGKIDGTTLSKANRNKESYDGGKEDLWKFFQAASPLCRDMILKCIWQKEVRNCSELFTPLETDNGKCCTFNMVPPSILHRFNMSGIREDPVVADKWEWDGEGLVKSRGKEAPQNYPDFPRRQKIPGQSFGLSILLNPGLEEYFCTTSDSHGFRMTAHLPIDVPHITDFGLAIKPQSEVFVNIRPEVTIADKETIGDFPAEQRECYFSGEMELGYYNFYTAKNCIDECLANLTYQECNCRRHYQPGEESKPLCGPKQFHCASNIKRKFVGTYKTRCKMCIPTCNEIAYHTETTYTPLQSEDILWTDNDRKLAEWSNKNVSIVHIFFGEDSTNAKLRKELYGLIDLIANFGGLMGLCLGFSGLSLVELIYFITLRAWCRIKRRRRESIEHHQLPVCHRRQEKKVGGGPVSVSTISKTLKRTETTTGLIDQADNDSYDGDDDNFEMASVTRASSAEEEGRGGCGGGSSARGGIMMITPKRMASWKRAKAINEILSSVTGGIVGRTSNRGEKEKEMAIKNGCCGHHHHHKEKGMASAATAACDGGGENKSYLLAPDVPILKSPITDVASVPESKNPFTMTL
ncbi:unnamed protein product [Orchesella dallaii]|uniref:Pickpocket protein 28 n=1 Tax=Orchesella dallaii TaxID=48710 RepID=A0ABP1R0Y1_9HEXA